MAPPPGSGPTDPDYPLSKFRDAFLEVLGDATIVRDERPLTAEEAFAEIVAELEE